jgi:hypothetical protein
MVSVWPACDGKEALALCTSETPPNWRLIDQLTRLRSVQAHLSPHRSRPRSAYEGAQWLATHEEYVLRKRNRCFCSGLRAKRLPRIGKLLEFQLIGEKCVRKSAGEETAGEGSGAVPGTPDL